MREAGLLAHSLAIARIFRPFLQALSHPSKLDESKPACPWDQALK